MCWADPPFSAWTCPHVLDGQRLDGPVHFWNDGRLYVVARKHYLEAANRKRTSLFEIGVDAVSTNPNGTLRDSVIIAAASGNAGSNANTTPQTAPILLHASGRTPTGQSTDFTITIPSYSPNAGTCNDFAIIDIWFANGDQYDVTVTRPDGTSVSAGPNQSQTNESTGGVGAYGTLTERYPLDCGAAAPGRTALAFDFYHQEHVETRAAAGFAIDAR